jgi:hypothetical protein
VTGILEPITFSQEVDGKVYELIIPKEFIRDVQFPGEHLTIMLRVTGPDTGKITDFFEDYEEQLFKIKTTENTGEKISDEFILTSAYIDEGPHLSADIDIEPPSVRAILDFKKNNS